MHLICMGFLMGAIFTLIIFGLGVLYDHRNNEEQRGNDSDMRVYIPNRHRDRRGDHGQDTQGGAAQ